MVDPSEGHNRHIVVASAGLTSAFGRIGGALAVNGPKLGFWQIDVENAGKAVPAVDLGSGTGIPYSVLHAADLEPVEMMVLESVECSAEDTAADHILFHGQPAADTHLVQAQRPYRQSCSSHYEWTGMIRDVGDPAAALG